MLTEHRQFNRDADYRALEDKFGTMVLRASEVETDYGHMLVFGVNDDMTARFDFANVRLDAQTLINEVARMGGIVVPCHPGRPNVGMYEHYQNKPPLENVVAVEVLNGGSRKGEDERSAELIAKYGFRGDRRIGQPSGEPDRVVRDEVRSVYQDDRRPGAGTESGQLRAGGFPAAAQSRCRMRSRWIAEPRRRQRWQSNYDPALINKVFEVTEPVEVKAEKIKRFCAALGETNPIYTDEEAAKTGPYGGIVAPPSFAVTFRNGRHFFENVPRFGRRGFDAGKDVEFVSPIRPGDQITLSSHVKEIYEKTGRTGTMVFVVIRSTLKNQKGEVVAHIDHRFMNRT